MLSYLIPFGLLMHIAFKFHYIHNNGLFVRLLKRIGERSPLALRLYQEEHNYGIEASGEQNELEALAELVSALIPQSLFLHEHTIQSVETLRESQPLIQEDSDYGVPYCLECQHHITETLNPFESCTVCGFSVATLTLDELVAYTHIDAKTAEELFSKLAEALIKHGTITVPTYNGIRRFSLLTTQEHEENGILICSPADISDSLMITQGELEALMMIEKPSVRLKPKLKFRAEHNLLRPLYPVFFPDDKITLAVCTALSRKGIFALYCDQIPSLRAASALGHHVIINVGRDMLPWHHPMPLKQPSCCTFERFKAFGGKDGLVLTTAKESAAKGCVEFVAHDEVSPLANAISFEPAHAALRCVVLEHDLQGKSLCGIYLSRQHTSQICGFSSKIGYLPMAHFSHNALNDPKVMLSSIAQMDGAGGRLVANFKNTYPKLYEQIEHARFETFGNVSMLSRLWAMAALFIGISEGDDIQTACEQLEATALEFNGKSGPRIDYKILKTDNGYDIDPRLAIRSAMSFKLAGVDEYLLSFGFIDSLADFIAQQAELADSNISIVGVTLSGSLFENRQLLMRTYNAIASNYTIFRNERLSMDGANVAVGAVTLGSE